MREPSRIVMGMAALLLAASGNSPAAAQDRGIVEGGLSGLGASNDYIAVGIGGMYAGAVVRATGPVSIYGNLNYYPDLGDGNGQVGVALRLGSPDWMVRPAIRAGLLQGSESFFSGGVGLTVGRRYGGRFVVDGTYRSGVSFAVVHLGGYVGF